MQKITILAALLMPMLVLAQIQPTRASYNLKGAVKHITAVQKYDGIKDMNFQEEYIFEQDGRQSQYVRKGFGGRVVTEYPQPVSGDSIRVPSYDHDGDLVKVLVYTKDSVLRQSIHNIYSKPGKLEVTITYNYAPQGMIVTKRLSYYNAKRQCRMVQVLTPEETIILEQTFNYDNHGNLTKKKQTSYDVDGTASKSVEKRKYKCDDHGNWVEQKYYMSGRMCYTTLRKVEYW